MGVHGDIRVMDKMNVLGLRSVIGTWTDRTS
jgi:hypothetical protein